MRYGLIGGKLSHSHSKTIHNLLGGYDYALYPLAPGELAAFLRQPGIGGLNVTIPYKLSVLPYCDTLTDAAKRIGSVNTLLYSSDRRITGHNTDYDGFLYLARRTGIAFQGKKVLILGSGGTSRTAAVAAEDLGAGNIVVISRTGENNYDTLDRHADADILINTTPVGMYPNVADCPVSLDTFPSLSGVLDVVYNPLRTRLILEAGFRKIPCAGGLPMLVAQAHAAAEHFTNTAIPQARIEEIVAALTRQLTNIVLIGMPGCGKSSVGRALAKIAGRVLIDTDALIEREAGISIPEIFEREGEAGFRVREAAAVAVAAREGGRIIATGGGAPLLCENRLALLQNGRIFYLQRDIETLAVSGRPLSTDLYAMYEQRAPIYRAFAHTVIDSNSRVQAAAQAVWDAFLTPC